MAPLASAATAVERRVDDEAPFSELQPLAPLANPGLPSQGDWSRRLWRWVLNALPVLLMGLLAAATWWLVKNTPVPPDPRPPAPARHVADFVMRGFSLDSHGTDGALISRLGGDEARHFPDNDTYEIDAPRVRRVLDDGRVLSASARSALANGDGSQVRLRGDARVLRQTRPGGGETLEFRSEFLELFTRTEQMRSHLPVQMRSARGELRAGNMEYDHLERVALFGGRVSGYFSPRGGALPEPAIDEAGERRGSR